MTTAAFNTDVLTEIQSGDGLSLSAAGRLFPGHRGTGTVSPSTVSRWTTVGAPTPGGQHVQLEAVRVGRRWLTSRAALARFVAALTAAARATPSAAPAVPTPAARQKASERAAEKLKQMGA